MEDKLEFEALYNAYELCLKNKKRKFGTYNFTNDELCKNLYELLTKLNKREYVPEASNCYVITDPALREIYAAQFSDRIVQHFYMQELNEILDKKLIDGCCSCRKTRGTDYALKLLKKFITESSNYGKKDCYFFKIDLSGYFMSINRKMISQKFMELIINEYKGKYKDLLIYLTPLIFENNPAVNCNYKCSEKKRTKVPDRRKMDSNSEYGMAIGNLTSQAGSNLNLSEFDNFVINELKLTSYVRYVDDIIIISEDKNRLYNALPRMVSKLKETHQTINTKKTKIDTVYHGVPFLGKVSYPYGYQKATKQVNIRICTKAKNTNGDSTEMLLSKVNSQIGILKNYNCRKLIQQYANLLPQEVKNKVKFDKNENKFAQVDKNSRKKSRYIKKFL